MGLRFVSPEWLYALLPLGCFYLVILFLWRRRYGQLGEMLGKEGLASALPEVSMARFAGRYGVYVLGLVSVVLALARPQWGFHWREGQDRGSELILLVDVSQSMMAADVAPNRLELARRAIYDLIAVLEGDHVGLVAFAGVPFLMCPPTADYDTFRLFAEMLDPSLIPIQGTEMGEALAMALNSFHPSLPSHARAIMVITDGEDHSAQVEAALVRAKTMGVKVFTAGLGSPEGAPIPLPEGGFKKDQGKLVVSKLHEEGLVHLAEATGGKFIRAVAGQLPLDALYRNEMKKLLGKEDLGVRRERVYHERFGWPLVLGIGLLSLFPFNGRPGYPGRPRKGNGSRWVFALVVSLGVSEMAHAADAMYNSGNRAYREGRYDEALKAFEEIVTEESLQSQAGPKTLFNLGNTLYRLGRLEEAVDLYNHVLSLDPDNRAAALNRGFVQKKLDEQSQAEREDKSEKTPSGEPEQENGQKQAGENRSAEGHAEEKPSPQANKDQGSTEQKDKEQKNTERRAERWLEAVPESGKEVLEKQIESQLPVQKMPEKDW